MFIKVVFKLKYIMKNINMGTTIFPSKHNLEKWKCLCLVLKKVLKYESVGIIVLRVSMI